jgi:hypothetical protein
MRIQSTHDYSARGFDAYFTCPEAVYSLLDIEADNLPQRIWEPAAGNGAISKILLEQGYTVFSTDVTDYGWDGCRCGVDYLKAEPPDGVEAIISNPPFRLAAQFLQKALREVDYVALLLRTNFLESVRRKPLLERHPPSRVWISSRRLPTMHRYGWSGKKAASNTCYAWFVWHRGFAPRSLRLFDWKDHAAGAQPRLFSEAAE